jgi:hypothetical protein
MGAGAADLYAENVSTDYTTGLQKFSSADFFGPVFNLDLVSKNPQQRSRSVAQLWPKHDFNRSWLWEGLLGRVTFGGVSIQAVLGRGNKKMTEVTPGN